MFAGKFQNFNAGGGRRDSYYDMIRALAILLVLLCHKGKMPGGSIGVSIFFCLSGFLITKLLIGLPEYSLLNACKFILRRFLRIYPLYLLMICAALLMAWSFAPDRLPNIFAGLPGLLTFTNLPTDSGYAIAVMWSLHVEFWFYLIFPLIFYMTYKRGMLPITVCALICLSYVAKHFDRGAPETWPIASTFWQMVIYSDQLLYGTICAILISSRSVVVDRFSSPFWFWGTGAASIAVAKYSVLQFWHPEMSLAAIFCAASILHHNANSASLRDNALLWLGRTSFSIYLVHALVLDYLPSQKLPDVLDTPSFFVVTILISFFTERLIERPSIALSHALTRFKAKPVKAQNQAVY